MTQEKETEIRTYTNERFKSIRSLSTDLTLAIVCLISVITFLNLVLTCVIIALRKNDGRHRQTTTTTARDRSHAQKRVIKRGNTRHASPKCAQKEGHSPSNYGHLRARGRARGKHRFHAQYPPIKPSFVHSSFGPITRATFGPAQPINLPSHGPGPNPIYEPTPWATEWGSTESIHRNYYNDREPFSRLPVVVTNAGAMTDEDELIHV